MFLQLQLIVAVALLLHSYKVTPRPADGAEESNNSGEMEQILLSLKALDTLINQRLNTLQYMVTARTNQEACQTTQQTCSKLDRYLKSKFDQTCPTAGYIKNGDSCYKFYTTPADWNTAVTRCHADGAHLVTIESKEEQEYLVKSLIHTIINMDSGNWWVGGYDKVSEGNWVWESTGEKIGAGSSFTIWNPGQPNGGTLENCIDLYKTFKYEWNSHVCDLEQYFICEQ